MYQGTHLYMYRAARLAGPPRLKDRMTSKKKIIPDCHWQASCAHLTTRRTVTKVPFVPTMLRVGKFPSMNT
jgi:hypothetical protein